VPQWGVDFGPENYVQEADITKRAVSFNKGCYCGQEVVCRLEMRGHVRRQLVGLRVPGEPVPRGTPFGEGAVVTSSAPSRKDG
jgi:folate-binding protein YgfZ